MSDDPAFRIEKPDPELEAATADAPDAPRYDFSTLKLPIEPGAWRDADDRMFHACFAILGQYVEEELGTEPQSWQDESCMYRGYRLHFVDRGEADPTRAAIDLWLWYRDELPALVKAYEEDIEEERRVRRSTARRARRARRRARRTGKPTPAVVVSDRATMFPHDWPETVKNAKLRDLIDLRRYLWT
jgi:hypothetical protein